MFKERIGFLFSEIFSESFITFLCNFIFFALLQIFWIATLLNLGIIPQAWCAIQGDAVAIHTIVVRIPTLLVGKEVHPLSWTIFIYLS